jgi:DNA-binding protein Fis
MRQNMNIDDIKSAIYEYIYQNLEGKNGYKEHLHIYEEPLLNAGLSKYKSQLKLSSILGINRNTLRKKILEHKIDA